MTNTKFKQWLAAMKTAGIVKEDKQAAELLGVTPQGIVHMKNNGANKRTALACAALLKRLKPYS